MIRFCGSSDNTAGGWKVPVESVAFDENGIKSRLLDLEHPVMWCEKGNVLV
jgi:hypothetical protein